MEIRSSFKIGAREITVPPLDADTLECVRVVIRKGMLPGERMSIDVAMQAILSRSSRRIRELTVDDLEELDEPTAREIIENLAAQMQMAVAARKAGSAGTRH